DVQDRCIIGRHRISHAVDFESPNHRVSVTNHTNVRGNSDLDVGHQAVELHLGDTHTHSGVGEVELDISHAGERAEITRDNPFTLTLETRPPARDTVPLFDV